MDTPISWIATSTTAILYLRPLRSIAFSGLSATNGLEYSFHFRPQNLKAI